MLHADRWRLVATAVATRPPARRNRSPGSCLLDIRGSNAVSVKSLAPIGTAGHPPGSRHPGPMSSSQPSSVSSAAAAITSGTVIPVATASSVAPSVVPAGTASLTVLSGQGIDGPVLSPQRKFLLSPQRGQQGGHVRGRGDERGH